MFIQKKRIVANDEMLDDAVVNAPEDEVVDEEGGDVTIDAEATDLLFEAEDVAELVAEITGEAVEVTVDDDQVEFAIGDEVYTVAAEGDEEILEAASRKVLRNKKAVAASTKRVARQAASVKAGRVVRKAPARRK